MKEQNKYPNIPVKNRPLGFSVGMIALIFGSALITSSSVLGVESVLGIILATAGGIGLVFGTYKIIQTALDFIPDRRKDALPQIGAHFHEKVHSQSMHQSSARMQENMDGLETCLITKDQMENVFESIIGKVALSTTFHQYLKAHGFPQYNDQDMQEDAKAQFSDANQVYHFNRIFITSALGEDAWHSISDFIMSSVDHLYEGKSLGHPNAKNILLDDFEQKKTQARGCLQSSFSRDLNVKDPDAKIFVAQIQNAVKLEMQVSMTH